MEEEFHFHNRIPTNCLRNYFTSTFSRCFPLSPSFNGGYSELRIEDDSDDGSLGDQPYCKPFVVLDVIWNLGFVLVSIFMLICTIREKPSSPLRVWISGYALQCLLHVSFVYYEFRRRNHGRVSSPESHSHSSFVKRLESANTIISSFWWVFGFYWIVSGGQSLLQDSPRLYWFLYFHLKMATLLEANGK
ncbi:E3 ubiquitin protein ligase RIE1 [Bienertia sinuspersici]